MPFHRASLRRVGTAVRGFIPKQEGQSEIGIRTLPQGFIDGSGPQEGGAWSVHMSPPHPADQRAAPGPGPVRPASPSRSGLLSPAGGVLSPSLQFSGSGAWLSQQDVFFSGLVLFLEGLSTDPPCILLVLLLLVLYYMYVVVFQRSIWAKIVVFQRSIWARCRGVSAWKTVPGHKVLWINPP